MNSMDIAEAVECIFYWVILIGLVLAVHYSCKKKEQNRIANCVRNNQISIEECIERLKEKELKEERLLNKIEEYLDEIK